MMKMMIFALLIAVSSAQLVLPLTYNYPLATTLRDVRYTYSPYLFHHPYTYNHLGYTPLAYTGAYWHPLAAFNAVKSIETPKEEKTE